jgi:hypothetical protein
MWKDLDLTSQQDYDCATKQRAHSTIELGGVSETYVQ